jgi:diguanylate cyclase (GGDEF)-like protein
MLRRRKQHATSVAPRGAARRDGPRNGRLRALRALNLTALGMAAYAVYRSRPSRLSEENRRLQQAKRRLELENDELTLQSHTDSLTGLSNRRYFFEHIEQDAALVDRFHQEARAHNAPKDGIDCLFLFFDLDDFKEVNDRYGHEVGDRVLVQVRWLLENTFRETDGLIRWGGDEFLVVGNHTNRNAASQVAERLRRQVAEHRFQLGHGKTVRLTCSIGFACYPFLPEDPKRFSWRDVLTLADRAQYVAKHGGRNAWVGLLPSEETVRVPREAISTRIATDTEGMLEDGSLAVETSRDQGSAAVLRGV